MYNRDLKSALNSYMTTESPPPRISWPRKVLAVLLLGTLLGWSGSAQAWWYHATRRAAARSILRRGIKPGKLRGRSRFGSGLYLSRRPATALAEKGKTRAVLRFKGSRYLKKNTVDLRKPIASKIRSRLGKISLRGKIKKSIIGPKLGRRLGRWAARKGKAIEYRSVKTRGSNLVIPKPVLKKHHRIVTPKKMVR